MIANTGTSEDAYNLNLSQALPAAIGLSSTGPMWILSFDAGTVVARKGGLNRGTEKEVAVSFTPSTPGVSISEIKYSADEFKEATEELLLTVIESYRSWSADLSETGSAIDVDGISNFKEYAFGGDPEVAAQTLEGTDERLLSFVERSPGGKVFTFLRRMDSEARALEYVVESSTDLTEGSWEVVTGGMTPDSPISLGNGFERVKMEFPDSSEDHFFRLKVTLNE